MNGIVQGVLVAIVVASSLIYSSWRLAPARLRLRMLEWLGALPGIMHVPGFAAWHARKLTQRAAGCGSCAPTAVPSPKRTPGALHR